MRYFLKFFVLAIFTTTLIAAPTDKPVRFHANLELGFSATLENNILFGKGNRLFSYPREGAQDVLFANWRGEVGLTILDNHALHFVYQPIFLSSQTVINEAVTFGNQLFQKGETINLDYYFPFYRLNYLYRFFNNQMNDLWVGAGLQIRNATIRFSSGDGTKRFETTNVGPVPLIALAGNFLQMGGFCLSVDASGFWAPIKYLNGDNVDVNGWIYDAGVRAKYQIFEHTSAMIGARIIGGGAIGTSNSPRQPYDGYSENTIMVINATTGLETRF